jgi:Uma2 family endonuclease
MSSTLTPAPPAFTTTPSPPEPRSPTVEEWARMSPEQRDAIEEDLFLAACEHEKALRENLSAEELATMADSEAHGSATWSTRGALRAFFGRTGSSLYVAANMAVFYPGETRFEPDLLAVRDIPLRDRDSYVVLKEGKGLDLVIEILYKGKRKKDLTHNVERYAELGIPEYFVADLRRHRVHGYHLPNAAARRYVPLLGDRGRYHSAVLGLDLVIQDNQLRFYYGTALVPLLEELTAAAERRAVAAEEAAAAAQEAATAAQETATAAQQAATAAQQAASAAQERLRLELVASILAILQVRGLILSDEAHRRVQTCQDVEVLARWRQRAVASSLEQLFLDS